MQRVESLSPSDLIWIQRLPTDPAKITFQDATRLAHLSRYLNSVENPSDSNLLQSVWMPVKEYHDRRQAVALAHNANLPPANLHLESVHALRDIIRTEMPGISEAAADAEATELMRKAELRRRNHASSLIERVEAIRAGADESEAKRTALVND
ncbi:hypothetical protein CVO76_13450 [Arthrobacter agilis]|uniref:Uncharacterized protein n=1 Tax=Arthrobacter agilis TaxID=37921 RepID=A0A2L0UH08_9MICC|nr:hypothetical protein CVO76_13450 [Arthrobacter agilis]